MTFIETYLKSIGKFLSQSGRQEKKNVGVLTLAWMWAHSPYNDHGYPWYVKETLSGNFSKFIFEEFEDNFINTTTTLNSPNLMS